MKAEVDLWELENELYDSGITTLCGVDEAGRGPLAGPVCCRGGDLAARARDTGPERLQKAH